MLKQRRPSLRTLEFPSSVMTHVAMRSDMRPFSDVRVRQAIALAIDRKGLIDSVLEGEGALNGPLRAFLRDWALPIDKLGEGAKYYQHNPAEARRLLAAAGYANGFPTSVCFTTYGSTLHSELYVKYHPDQPKNQGHINDPVVNDLMHRQARTFDLAKRRELIHDIQRHLAKQQYYVELPSDRTIGVWDGVLKNYAPNYGNDYGGRLQVAWLER